MTQLKQDITAIADTTKLTYSAWYRMPVSVPDTFTQHLLDFGAVPGTSTTDVCSINIIRTVGADVFTSVNVNLSGPFFPAAGDFFAGIPIIDISATNFDGAVPSSDPLFGLDIWNNLTFSVDISVGNAYGVGMVAPFTQGTKCAVVCNNINTTTKALPDTNVFSTGVGPNWKINDTDLYGGPPAVVTSRVWNMPVVGTQIGMPFNDNYLPSASPLVLELFNVQVWYGTYVDLTVPANLAKFVVSDGTNIFAPSDIRAAQDAFGASDIWFNRDSVSDIKFEDNQGTAGPFTLVGTGPSDFNPPPVVM